MSDTIGIFDSGIGGLTIWLEIKELIPHARTIYVSDNQNVPYGEKSRNFITQRAERITDFLIDSGADIIVIACNTATSAAIKHLRKSYNMEFVGIEPAIKPAAEQSANGIVGVLATKGTLESDKFKKTRNQYANGVEVIMQQGKGLVRLIESGDWDSDALHENLNENLYFINNRGVDTLVLGCTHYPLIKEQISRIIGPEVLVIDPGKAVARQVLRKMKKKMATETSTAQHKFFSTGSAEPLLKTLVKLGVNAPKVENVNL